MKPLRATGYGSRVIAFVFAPFVFPQSRVVLSHLPVLPEAKGRRYGSIDGPDPLRLLILGDSTAAGVGAERQTDGLPGELSRGLAARLDRGVNWRVHAGSGATTGQLRSYFLGAATGEPSDVIFLSTGVNDVMQLRRKSEFMRDLREILDALREESPDAWIIVPGVPRMERFESLPHPLGSILGARAHRINTGAREVIKGRYRVVHTKPWPIGVPDFFASDKFHPSATGYAAWADAALDYWLSRR